MNKEIWLSVIREELVLLEKLATGMIADDQLTIEEIELAITRSKIVTREFEMLFNQVQIGGAGDTSNEPVELLSQAEPEAAAEMVVQELVVAEESPQATKEEGGDDLNDSDGGEDIAIEESKEEVVEEIPSSPHPLVPPSPPAESEENSTIDQEVKKEEHPLFKLSPIKSLKEGLTLNDRYLYQRELFDNDKSRLDETIAEMDRLANIQEAVAYLKANFRWNKGEASEKFVLLVKRRFSEPKG